RVVYVRTDGNNSNLGIYSQASGAWLTIQWAIDHMIAGDTCYVAPGTYSENISRANLSGTATNKTYLLANTSANKFIGLSAGPIIIDGGGNLTPCLDMSNCDYIIIDHFTLRNCLGDYTNAHIYLRNGTDNAQIKDCEIYRQGYVGESTAQGIKVNSSANVIIQDNVIHHLRYTGIGIESSNSAVLARNRLHNIDDESIILDASNNCRAENNTGYSNDKLLELYNNSDNAVIVNNTAFNNINYGIRLNTGCDNNTCFNNLCYNNTNYNIRDEGSGSLFDYNFCSGTGGTANAGINGITSGNPDLTTDGHIGSASVCADAGTSTFNAQNAPSNDIDNDDRPYNLLYDIGSDERMPYSLIWKYPNTGLLSAEVRSSCCIRGGTAYFGCNNDTLYALYAVDGSVKWKYAANGDIRAIPMVFWDAGISKYKIYFGTLNNRVYAIRDDGNIGTALWTHNTPSGITGTVGSDAIKVYFGCANGRIYACSTANGNEAWYTDIGDTVFAGPAIGDGNIHIGSDSDSLYKLQCFDGTPLLKYGMDGDIKAWSWLWGDKLYIGSGGSTLYALYTANYDTVWAPYTTPTGAIESPVWLDLFDQNYIYFGDNDGKLYSIDRSNKAPKTWSPYQAGGAIRGSPLVWENVVYFGSQDGYFYAINKTTGALIWRYNTGAPISSSPSTDGSYIYIGSEAGRVFCFSK
ncbi:MAG: PQQ-binding-like beta-propeller repeat protein, partial [Candidatus Stahlbacteria bacterium]|nr:PQQ-binding-like beta-propeller repeat protein [Candidatus Stahlbacteria bacterium]